MRRVERQAAERPQLLPATTTLRPIGREVYPYAALPAPEIRERVRDRDEGFPIVRKRSVGRRPNRASSPELTRYGGSEREPLQQTWLPSRRALDIHPLHRRRAPGSRESRLARRQTLKSRQLRRE